MLPSLNLDRNSNARARLSSVHRWTFSKMSRKPDFVLAALSLAGSSPKVGLSGTFGAAREGLPGDDYMGMVGRFHRGAPLQEKMEKLRGRSSLVEAVL